MIKRLLFTLLVAAFFIWGVPIVGNAVSYFFSEKLSERAVYGIGLLATAGVVLILRIILWIVYGEEN